MSQGATCQQQLGNISVKQRHPSSPMASPPIQDHFDQSNGHPQFKSRTSPYFHPGQAEGSSSTGNPFFASNQFYPFQTGFSGHKMASDPISRFVCLSEAVFPPPANMPHMPCNFRLNLILSHLLQPTVFLQRRWPERVPAEFRPCVRSSRFRDRRPTSFEPLPAEHQQNASFSDREFRRCLLHDRNAQLPGEFDTNMNLLTRLLPKAKVERGDGRGSWHEDQRYPSPATSPISSHRETDSNPLRHHQQSRTIFRCVSSKPSLSLSLSWRQIFKHFLQQLSLFQATATLHRARC